MTGITVPDKLYFKIGEVAKLIGVEPYVLRYWETEFPQITPVKSQSGQRLYRRDDVETIIHIRELLYGQKFTIDGARNSLSRKKISRREFAKQQQMPLALDDLMTTGSAPESVNPRPIADDIRFKIQNIIDEMKVAIRS